MLQFCMGLKALPLLANSAVGKLMIFFLIFHRKQDLTFHANCLHEMSNLFSKKNKEKYFNVSSDGNFSRSAKR